MKQFQYPHKIEAIYFDFDGVVVDTEPLYEEAGRELLKSLNLDPVEDFLQSSKGLSEFDYFSKLIDAFNLEISLDEIQAQGRKILCSTFNREIPYVDGFYPFFQSFKSILNMGLVTATRGAFLNQIIGNLTIHNQFDLIVDGDAVQHSKPHPEPYALACKKMGLNPKNVMVIEDSIPGTSSAFAAGCLTIGITTSYSKKELINTHLVVDSFKELSQFLHTMNLERKNELV